MDRLKLNEAAAECLADHYNAVQAQAEHRRNLPHGLPKENWEIWHAKNDRLNERFWVSHSLLMDALTACTAHDNGGANYEAE